MLGRLDPETGGTQLKIERDTGRVRVFIQQTAGEDTRVSAYLDYGETEDTKTPPWWPTAVTMRTGGDGSVSRIVSLRFDALSPGDPVGASEGAP